MRPTHPTTDRDRMIGEGDWTIGEQSREAELARFAARLDAIFERGKAEAANPTNPELRAWNDANYEAQRDGGAGLDLTGMVEAKAAAAIDDANRREPWAKRVAGGRR